MSPKVKRKEFELIPLFERFIQDSEKGKRLQPNGKRISSGTIANYGYTLKLLEKFCISKSVVLRIRPIRFLNKRTGLAEKNYWKKFYKRFSDFLYKDCGHFDNYVGQTIKNIRVFFNYLNKDLLLGTGEFHKYFYVRKEEIAIFPLLPEELNYLIYDQAFEEGLSKRLRETKDFFVFGCTVALRCSDLFQLKKTNLRIINGVYYLVVRSQKTNTGTLVKLPSYAVAILKKYNKRPKLLPHFNKTNLNKYIKILLEKANFTTPIQKIRDRRGVASYEHLPFKNALRFCDIASTHTMRRTAITTMLCLGVPEQVVRKISGHSPSGKEFYRYVLWAQVYQDKETDKVFERLEHLKLQRV